MILTNEMMKIREWGEEMNVKAREALEKDNHDFSKDAQGLLDEIEEEK